MLKPYDKEFMKAAILKHDQIFKEQVHELHRLYRIQKLLMSNIPTNNNNISSNQQQVQAPNNQKQNSVQVGIGNNKQLISSNVVDTINSNNQMLGLGGKLIEEDEIELTLGLSNYYSTSNSGNVDRNQRRKKTITSIPNANNQKLPRSNSTGQTQSSSSTGSSQTNKKTRSNTMLRQQSATAAGTGHELLIKNSQDFSRRLAWGLAQGNGNGIPPAVETNHALTFQLNGTAGNITHNAAGHFNTTSSLGGGEDQHMRQQPPWLHQALSLKLT